MTLRRRTSSHHGGSSSPAAAAAQQPPLAAIENQPARTLRQRPATRSSKQVAAALPPTDKPTIDYAPRTYRQPL